MKLKFIPAICLALILNITLLGSDNTNQNGNFPVEDPLVQNKIEKWQDLKFGLFMHWGAYSQWGIVESWSLCGEDREFINRNRPEEKYPDYDEYKKAYRNLQKTFNPLQFDPEKWVEPAKKAGMKYVIFTTKHHDGFCMFDTKETDYKITSTLCPYHLQPKANITKEIFNTFRDNGFMIGAYFSKPDWDSENYWWPYFPTRDRNANYDPLKYPDRWQKFKEFTFNQIEELMTGYGSVDILWLDGGQVNPSQNNQDINMPGIAKMARQHQPGLIIVDRGQKGPYTNYETPEQRIPENAILTPWETCMTMGDQWSYKPFDNYKSTQQLVHLLVNIVAKGGNFLLNIGPQPDGTLPAEAVSRLEEIGEWMEVNGEAIYGTRPVAPYKEGSVAFTQKENVIYAIWTEESEGEGLPETVSFSKLRPQKNSKIFLLGFKQPCKWEVDDKGVTNIVVPEKAIKSPPCKYACVFKFVL
jgi:alpha-L-fucosidase